MAKLQYVWLDSSGFEVNTDAVISALYCTFGLRRREVSGCVSSFIIRECVKMITTALQGFIAKVSKKCTPF